MDQFGSYLWPPEMVADATYATMIVLIGAIITSWRVR